MAYFADLAVTEFALDAPTARSVVSIMLSGVDSLVSQARSKSRGGGLQVLEDTYVEATIGALTRVSSRPSQSRVRLEP